MDEFLPMIQKTTLRVSDLIELKEVTLDDSERIFQAIDMYRNDLRIWLPFVDTLKNAADERAFLSSVLEVPYAQRNSTFAIEKEGAFCGLIGFVCTDQINHKTEIGYWLLPPFRKQGIVTACVHALCKWGFTEREMNCIQIKCAFGNRASNAIPLRLGFRYEGVERDGQLLTSGDYTDVNRYSLLKREFRENANEQRSNSLDTPPSQ